MAVFAVSPWVHTTGTNDSLCAGFSSEVAVPPPPGSKSGLDFPCTGHGAPNHTKWLGALCPPHPLKILWVVVFHFFVFLVAPPRMSVLVHQEAPSSLVWWVRSMGGSGGRVLGLECM